MPRPPCVHATSPTLRKLVAGYAAFPQMAGRDCRMPLLMFSLALRTTKTTPGLIATGDYPPSLCSPWRAAMAFTPVFNTITGYIVLGESVSLMGFSGILLVVAGAWILNIKHARHATGINLLAPFKAITREHGSRLMLIVAMIYSLTSVMGKGALQYVPPQFMGPFYYVALGFAAILLFRPRETSTWKVLTRHLWVHLFIGLFMAGMVVSHFYAIGNVEVAYMIAVKRTSLLFGMVYGAWLFKETGLIKNMAAGIMMIMGVYLIIR